MDAGPTSLPKQFAEGVCGGARGRAAASIAALFSPSISGGWDRGWTKWKEKQRGNL